MQKRVDCTPPSPTPNLAQVLHNAFIAESFQWFCYRILIDF